SFYGRPDNYPNGHAIEDVRVIDLTSSPAWSSYNGLAVAHDEFDRADNNLSLGTATSGANWTVDNGTWGITNNQAKIQATTAGFAVAWIPAQSDGIFQSDITYPASGTPFWGLIIRRESPGNYIRITNDGADAIKIQSV